MRKVIKFQLVTISVFLVHELCRRGDPHLG